MTDTVVCIVQARMGSTRLPRKVLADLCGRPLLGRVFDRVRASTYGARIVLATTTGAGDDVLDAFAMAEGVSCFRGSEDDVLDRYYQAARAHGAGTVVRITADDPLKDPGVIDDAVRLFMRGDCDYASNTLHPTYPEGVDVEVFSFAALERVWHDATRPFERQHVTPHIWMNPDRFRLAGLEHGLDLSSMRWTVDTAEDLAFARAVYARLLPVKPDFRLDDVVTLLRSSPELARLMPVIERNAGLKKSMQDDDGQDRNR